MAETWSNYTMSYVHHFLGDVHKHEFSAWNAAYLQKSTYSSDLEVDMDNFDHQKVSTNMMRGVVKYYA